MPHYLYECPVCKTRFVKEMSIKEYEKLQEGDISCPREGCDGVPVRNIDTPLLVIYNAKGFYSTDG